MNYRICGFFFLSFFIACLFSFAQDSTAPFKWKVSSKKISGSQYELSFSSRPVNGWQLYAPGQLLGDVPAAELQFSDSSIRPVHPFKDSGTIQTFESDIFGVPVKVYEGTTTWKRRIRIEGTVPATLQGTLLYTYGRADEFYPSTSLTFSVPLEGGTSAASRIKIPTIDIKKPVNDCGDDEAAGKSLFNIFLLGFFGGLIALITPCVFPLIPLTVSFFTKRSGSRKKGITNAFLYGFSIFLIYFVLSLPFHIVDQTHPEVLNNISTNVGLNLVFFVVFIFFALSFFGFYEIGLPSGFANKIDARSGLSDFWGIFFMALTLAIVSFSCTGPILGSLLAGVSTNSGGATQLSFGMGGFGMGLGLPFALFALFPGWLQSLPRSGGWLHTVKVVLGFLELALAVKFFSNADLVEQWGLMKRELFIAIWVVIGIAIILYLLGIIRFAHDEVRKKVSLLRWTFIAFFGAGILYLVPGITNTRAANLHLISGFPPPLCYSIYRHPVNCEKGIEPLRDYGQALELAKRQGKPVLIDFTGWACVNCRRMEEKIWTHPEVSRMMKNDFVVVSLYVDERKNLPLAQQVEYITKTGKPKSIVTIGDKWSTFQFENFNSLSQPQYAIISPNETALTKTKSYTSHPNDFIDWLKCGLEASKREASRK